MKRKIVIPTLVNLAGIPIIMIVLGLILVFNPDAASALISQVLGWVLVVYGAFFGISAFMSIRSKRTSMLLYAVLCLFIGTYLVRNPLDLAAIIGKFLGIILGIRGVNGVFDALNVKKQGGTYTTGLAVGGITLAVGIGLMVAPLTPSRLLMIVIGLIFVVAGIVNLLAKKGEIKALLDPADDNIIDV